MFSRGQIMGFGTPIDINVTYSDAEMRKRVLVPPWHHANTANTQPEVLFVFANMDAVEGEVVITTEPDEVTEFTELKIEFVGQVNTISPDCRQTTEFCCQELVLEKAPPGSPPLKIDCVKVVPYNFGELPKPHESYNGILSQLRYFTRVTLKRVYAPEVVEEHPVWVVNPQPVSSYNQPIKMEVGLDKRLHIEFEYNKRNYHLQDVVLGKIYFLVVKLRIKQMELALLKRESTGSYSETDTVTKFEVMDGHPVSGVTIPVRVFLAPYNLTPTYKHVNNQFSVRYYLNLVLVDDNDRRYYKQQEIIVWRKGNDAKEIKHP
eukprot:TRINITY_DN1459_c0_g6_i1.p1 TRINITY_DN1459_c0_g6~~TRINITY_DN1459_c0_g6_i1.p1  ORF type:complete len:319 (+),score=139.70 TRINITY_DN1459_c0_g6_i1:76-1032(+)